jgi:GH15 family glucan-1,4-alpha-glucosidase
MGRGQDARHVFARLLELRNDVGLLSEEYDPATGRLLGNFPQAFTHVSLVNTASNLSSITRPAVHRSSGEDGPGTERADASERGEVSSE